MKVKLIGGVFDGEIELDAQNEADLPDVLTLSTSGGMTTRQQEYYLQRPVAEFPIYKAG